MGLTLSFQFFDLPLKHPFTISRYTVTIQKTVIVSISDGINSGYGEATVNPYYHSTTERLAASLLKVKPFVDSAIELHPTELWQQLSSIIQDDYFALCAVDIAYWDYYSKTHSQMLRSFWSNEGDVTPLTSYTIGIDSLEMMQQKIIEKPWPIYKIKLGTADDLFIVESLRKITDATFRIDANCAWTSQQTIDNAKILKELNVEFIEQPLKAEDVVGMKRVRKQSVLPIIADESCQREADVEACSEIFHGINIKLMKCGGITPGLRMISKAKDLGLLLMAGCMTESTVGISGLCQIAPLLTYLDADGALLLNDDIARGVVFNFGQIVYSKDFGIGVKMLEK
jgi:L-alanine-DL-glutamate epimerase-like enolase superfamily enzyme